ARGRGGNGLAWGAGRFLPDRVQGLPGGSAVISRVDGKRGKGHGNPCGKPETQAPRAMGRKGRQIRSYAGARVIARVPCMRAGSRVYGPTLPTLPTLPNAAAARVSARACLPACLPTLPARDRARAHLP